MSKSKRFISLAERNPELVSEWHPTLNGELSPTDVSYGSAEKRWWRCPEGHVWESSPNNRTGKGRGCPECSEIIRKLTLRKNLLERRGSLAKNNPTLAKEWHPTKNVPLTPYDVTANCTDRVWWQCGKDSRHEWEDNIHIRNQGNGCPICSGYRILVGINDLSTLRPDIAAQWHPTENGDLKPTDFTCGSDKKVWWICEQGHKWDAKINNRTNGNNCPICIGKRVLVGYNDLATVMPLLAKEWHPTKNKLTPYEVTTYANKKVWWMCERKHEWQTAVAKRSDGRRCPVCFGQTRTSFPEQAVFFYLRQLTTAYNRYMAAPKTEIDVYLPEYQIGIEYDGDYFHKGEEAERREKRKQETLTNLGITLIRIREIEGQTSEYTIYSKRGSNDIELSQTIKLLIALVSRLTQVSFDVDIDITRDRNKIYEQYIFNEKEKSLAVVNPQVASEWHPTKNGSLIPEYVSANCNSKAWWQCRNGHEWSATINSRNKGAGCRECYKLRRKSN